MNATVRLNQTDGRYEVVSDGQVAGFADYRLRPGRISFTHTEISPSHAGRGLARRLIVDALEDAHRRGLAVHPYCPYVRAVILRDPHQFLDLVPPTERKRFGLPQDEAASPVTGSPAPGARRSGGRS